MDSERWSVMSEMITIDGSQGEGGGQILRTSLSLSAVYGQPFEMVNVRANREKPGLKRQHLTCVRAVAEICGAKVVGDEVGSMRLTFEPGPIRGGAYRFDIGTAGSVTLVAQTVIPVLLRADAPSEVTITGGTHVPFAPVWEFFAETYLPQVQAMGGAVEAELVDYGFYPAGGGRVVLRIQPMKDNGAYYRLNDRGAYRGGTVVGVVANLDKSIAEDEVERVVCQLPNLNLRREVRTVDSVGPGNYCYAKLEFEHVSVVISEVGTHGKSRKAVANSIVEKVKRFVNHGAAVEVHLSDQLLVPLLTINLHDGRAARDQWAEFTIDKKWSKHFETNRGTLWEFEHSFGLGVCAVPGNTNIERVCPGLDGLVEEDC